MRHHPKFKSELKKKTIELINSLENSNISQIARDTGLSETWIRMFARNELTHSDVGRVETLYNYLNKIPLSV